jgi:hypothetical protein
MPAGRRETVRREEEGEERFAARMKDSASACGRIG